MNFAQVRERSADGGLLRAGYTWPERRDGPLFPFPFGMMLGFVVIVLGFAGSTSRKPRPGLVVSGIGAVVFIGCLFGFGRCSLTRPNRNGFLAQLGACGCAGWNGRARLRSLLAEAPATLSVFLARYTRSLS